ncbi:MAG: Mbeg1-like protein [Bacilli bacterium]|nr:Mbeg1-like protein [Bacilli bacterium]
MSIFNYIKKYGCYSFEEVKFNIVDNFIFSALTYSSLDDYVSPNRINKKTIREVGSSFFNNFNKKEKNITAVRLGIKILDKIRNTRRYGDLLLYNYSYIGDDKQQFCALTIEINRKLVYVSFEGTDELISGWREDFEMSYEFPVLSQRRAIDYINKHFLFNNKSIIMGGHSKGGNLAMVAAMYSNFWVKDKIINIYNNDGPGLRKKEIESKYFKSIESRLISVIPNYCLVGLTLRHNNNFRVVKSRKKGILAHDMANWMIEDKDIKEVELSSFSKYFDDSIIRWLDKYSDEERKKFTDGLFMIFDRASVSSLVEILNNKKLILKLIYETKDIDKGTKRMLKDFLYMIFSYFKGIKINPFTSS